MKTFKLDLRKCIAIYPNCGKLFSKCEDGESQEYECFFGHMVAYATFHIQNNSVNKVELFGEDNSIVAIAELLDGERVKHYWRHQYVCRDHIGSDTFRPRCLANIITFCHFLLQHEKELVSEKEFKVCSQKLWCTYFESTYPKEIKEPAEIEWPAELAYPAIEIGIDQQFNLKHLRFELAAKLTSKNQWILDAYFNNGILQSIVDFQSKRICYIKYPQKEGDCFVFQDLSGNATDMGCGEYRGTKDDNNKIAINGFDTFWPKGHREVRFFTNSRLEKEMANKGVFIKIQRELLCDEEKMLAQLPTINFHITKKCNMHCLHCFAEFKERGEVCFEEAKSIIEEIAEYPAFKKINFSGGEPTLFKGIEELLKIAHDKGKETSIVTNGTELLRNKKLLKDIARYTDIIAFSIDSFNEKQNKSIGRYYGNRTICFDEWRLLAEEIRKVNRDIKIKVNTVVSHLNFNEEMIDQMKELKVSRWKILMMMEIEGEHAENNPEKICPSDKEFNTFVSNNKQPCEITIVVEGKNAMKGSYIMIAPDGTVFNNVNNHHVYSEPIKKVGLLTALEQTPFDKSRFYGRGGEY